MGLFDFLAQPVHNIERGIGNAASGLGSDIHSWWNQVAPPVQQAAQAVQQAPQQAAQWAGQQAVNMSGIPAFTQQAAPVVQQIDQGIGNAANTVENNQGHWFDNLGGWFNEANQPYGTSDPKRQAQYQAQQNTNEVQGGQQVAGAVNQFQQGLTKFDPEQSVANLITSPFLSQQRQAQNAQQQQQSRQGYQQLYNTITYPLNGLANSATDKKLGPALDAKWRAAGNDPRAQYGVINDTLNQFEGDVFDPSLLQPRLKTSLQNVGIDPKTATDWSNNASPVVNSLYSFAGPQGKLAMAQWLFNIGNDPRATLVGPIADLVDAKANGGMKTGMQVQMDNGKPVSIEDTKLYTLTDGSTVQAGQYQIDEQGRLTDSQGVPADATGNPIYVQMVGGEPVTQEVKQAYKLADGKHTIPMAGYTVDSQGNLRRPVTGQDYINGVTTIGADVGAALHIHGLLKAHADAQGKPSGANSEEAANGGTPVTHFASDVNRSAEPVQAVDPSAVGADVQARVAADPAASTASQALQEAGGEVHAVGGVVRDAIAGVPHNDVDLRVHGLPAEQVQSTLNDWKALDPDHREVVQTGKGFGVFRAIVKDDNGTVTHESEIALPRTETSTGPGYTDFKATVDPHLGGHDDAARRDFTKNSAYVSMHDGQLHDPFGAVQDIHSNTLRSVSPTSISEDPVRGLRALTDISRRGSVPDEQLMQQMRDNAPVLSAKDSEGNWIVPRERLQADLDKAAAGDNFAGALQVMQQTGILRELFPDLEQQVGFDQRSAYHNQALWDHTLGVVQRVSELNADPDVRWAALFHDVGKPESQWMDATGKARYYTNEAKGKQGHEFTGARIAREVLTELRMPNERISKIASLVKHHMWDKNMPAKSLAAKFANDLGGKTDSERRALSLQRTHAAMDLREADAFNKGKPTDGGTSTRRAELREIEAAPEQRIGLPPGFGHDLIGIGVKPGQKMGQLINALKDGVERGVIPNDRAALLDAARKMYPWKDHELRNQEPGERNGIQQETAGVSEGSREGGQASGTEEARTAGEGEERRNDTGPGPGTEATDLARDRDGSRESAPGTRPTDAAADASRRPAEPSTATADAERATIRPTADESAGTASRPAQYAGLATRPETASALNAPSAIGARDIHPAQSVSEAESGTARNEPAIERSTGNAAEPATTGLTGRPTATDSGSVLARTPTELAEGQQAAHEFVGAPALYDRLHGDASQSAAALSIHVEAVMPELAKLDNGLHRIRYSTEDGTAHFDYARPNEITLNPNRITRASIVSRQAREIHAALLKGAGDAASRAYAAKIGKALLNATDQQIVFHVMAHEALHGMTMRALGLRTFEPTEVAHALAQHMPPEFWIHSIYEGLGSEVEAIWNHVDGLDVNAALAERGVITPEQHATLELSDTGISLNELGTATYDLLEHIDYQLMRTHDVPLSSYSMATPRVYRNNINDQHTATEAAKVTHAWYTSTLREAPERFAPGFDPAGREGTPVEPTGTEPHAEATPGASPLSRDATAPNSDLVGNGILQFADQPGLVSIRANALKAIRAVKRAPEETPESFARRLAIAWGYPDETVPQQILMAAHGGAGAARIETGEIPVRTASGPLEGVHTITGKGLDLSVAADRKLYNQVVKGGEKGGGPIRGGDAAVAKAMQRIDVTHVKETAKGGRVLVTDEAHLHEGHPNQIVKAWGRKFKDGIQSTFTDLKSESHGQSVEPDLARSLTEAHEGSHNGPQTLSPEAETEFRLHANTVRLPQTNDHINTPKIDPNAEPDPAAAITHAQTEPGISESMTPDQREKNFANLEDGSQLSLELEATRRRDPTDFDPTGMYEQALKASATSLPVEAEPPKPLSQRAAELARPGDVAANARVTVSKKAGGIVTWNWRDDTGAEHTRARTLNADEKKLLWPPKSPGKGGGGNKPPTRTGGAGLGGFGQPPGRPKPIPAAHFTAMNNLSTLGGKPGKMGHALNNLVFKVQHGGSPEMIWADPRAWFSKFYYNIAGSHFLLNKTVSAFKEAVPEVKDRIALGKTFDGSPDEATRVKNVAALKPELQPIAHAMNAYYQFLGITLRNAGAIKEAREFFLPHMVLSDVKTQKTWAQKLLLQPSGPTNLEGKAVPGTRGGSFGRFNTSMLAREVDNMGEAVNPDVASLKARGWNVIEDPADIMSAHGTGMLRALQVSRFITMAEKNIIHTKDFQGAPIVHHDTPLASDLENQMGHVQKGSAAKALKDYLVYKPLIEHIERLQSIYDMTGPGGAALRILHGWNSLYKFFKFSINPVHLWNVGGNVASLMNGGGPIGMADHLRYMFPVGAAGLPKMKVPLTGRHIPFTGITPFGERKFFEPLRDNQFTTGGQFRWGVNKKGWNILHNDPKFAGELVSAGMRLPDMANMPEDVAHSGAYIPGISAWEHIMWNENITTSAFGLAGHLFEQRMGKLEGQLGRSANESERTAALVRTVSDVKNAFGFADNLDMSKNWRVLGSLLPLARDWTTSQLRSTGRAFEFMPNVTLKGGIVKRAIGKNEVTVGPGRVAARLGSIGGGEDIWRARGTSVSPEAADRIARMRASTARSIIFGGTMKLMIGSAIMSTVASRLLTGQWSVSPVENYLKDPMHTFDIYNGRTNGKDSWIHNPTFGFQRELMQYGLAVGKAIGQGHGVGSLVDLVGGSTDMPNSGFSGKVNPALTDTITALTGYEINNAVSGFGWKKDAAGQYTVPPNVDNDKTIANIRQSLDNMHVPDGSSLENRLIYMFRNMAPFQAATLPGGPTSDPGQLAASLGLKPGTLKQAELQAVGTRESGGMQYFNVPQSMQGSGLTPGSTVDANQFYAQIAAMRTDEKALVHAASQGDAGTVNAIKAKYGWSDETAAKKAIAQMAAVAYPQDNNPNSPSNINYIPPAVQKEMALSTSPVDTLNHNHLSPQQQIEFQGAKTANMSAALNDLKSTADYQAANEQDRIKMMASLAGDVQKVTAYQYGVQYGFTKGNPITSEQATQLIKDTYHYRHDAEKYVLREDNTNYWLLRNPDDRSAMLKYAGDTAAGAAWDAEVSHLYAGHDLQQAIRTDIDTMSMVRANVQQMVTYNDAFGKGAAQKAIMDQYVATAKKMITDSFRAIKTGVQPDQLQDQVLRTIQMQEDSKLLLHDTDMYKAADPAGRKALDTSYDNFATAMAYKDLGKPWDKMHAVSALNNVYGTDIYAKVTADTAFYNFQNQFGGAKQLKIWNDELSAIKKQYADTANVDAATLAKQDAQITKWYDSTHPDHAAYSKALTAWKKSNPYGKLYAALAASDYLYAANLELSPGIHDTIVPGKFTSTDPATGVQNPNAALTDQEIAQFAYNAGFRGQDLAIAVAITHPESGGIPTNVQQGQPQALTGWGLWQITPGGQELLDPQANANEAYRKYQQAGGFSPWTTYVGGQYRQFVDPAIANYAPLGG
jgi:putative nucleotidyltransferase with HDIG domain